MTKMNKEVNIDESDLVEAALNFWFKGHEHIRSPFPLYIQDQLKKDVTEKFNKWTANISDKAKKEVNDEIVAEKFEEMLFETAVGLVVTEDEKLTILYPFMPRIGDVMKPSEENKIQEESTVTDRHHLKRGDHAFLKIKFKSLRSEKEWETEFELPE